MAQSPLQIDAIQIEPAAVGIRTIDRDSSGDLRFIDPSNSTGITLSGTCGLRSVGSILLVGKTGPGAQYNTIQAALDAVPGTSSLTDPTLVLVGPGVYQENLVIEKDGIWMVGLGGAILEPSVADATVSIKKGVTTTPRWCRLQNLRILNSNNGEECVLVLGGAASEVAEDGVSIYGCELVASGVGTYQVRADTVNKVLVQGGTFEGSASNSLLRATNCYQVSVADVDQAFNFQLDYDTVNPLPSLVGGTYSLRNLHLKGDVQSTLNGGGSLTIGGTFSASGAGNLTFTGDGAGSFRGDHSSFGDVVVNLSAPLVLSSCTRGTIAGAGTIAEDLQEGSVTFVASVSEAVALPVIHPDASYTVHTETELTEAIGVTSRTAAGFVLSFAGAQSTTVNYKLLRRIT